MVLGMGRTKTIRTLVGLRAIAEAAKVHPNTVRNWWHKHEAFRRVVAISNVTRVWHVVKADLDKWLKEVHP